MKHFTHPRLWSVLGLLGTTLRPAGAGPGTTTIMPGGEFAWAQNAGWINARHALPATSGGLITGDYFLCGDAWGQNIGWIRCGSGAPTDGIRYSNTTATDYGVNHDGTGNLSGYAWAQNAGWINFGWAAPSDGGRPRINLQTGKFTGFAWGQNLGWIRLDGLITSSLPVTDTDADGLSDAWERQHFASLTKANAATDSDGDGDTDAAEFLAGTNPASALSRFEILHFTISPSGLQESFTFTSNPGRFYEILAGSDLQTWSTAGTVAGAPGTTTTVTVTLPASPNRQFLTPKPKRPLTP